jgi:hypothetical protein
LIDDVGGKLLTKLLEILLVREHRAPDRITHLVSLDLSLCIVLQQVSEALLEAHDQPVELLLEDLLVKEVAHAQTAAGHLGAVGWADALLGGACKMSAAGRLLRSWRVRTNEALAELYLLEAIDLLVHVEHDMRAVGDVDAALGLEPMLLQRLELLEEARHVDDAAAADDVDAVGVDEARGQDVEVVRDAVGDNGVARVVTALGTAADLRFVCEDVGELALAFVAPLGAEDNSDGHVRRDEGRDGSSGGRGFNCPWDVGAGIA